MTVLQLLASTSRWRNTRLRWLSLLLKHREYLREIQKYYKHTYIHTDIKETDFYLPRDLIFAAKCSSLVPYKNHLKCDYAGINARRCYLFENLQDNSAVKHPEQDLAQCLRTFNKLLSKLYFVFVWGLSGRHMTFLYDFTVLCWPLVIIHEKTLHTGNMNIYPFISSVKSTFCSTFIGHS